MTITNSRRTLSLPDNLRDLPLNVSDDKTQEWMESVKNFIRIQKEKGNLISANTQALLGAVWILYNASSLELLNNLGFQIDPQDWENVCRVMLSNLQISSDEGSKNYYDAVASNYDALYTDGISLAENAIVGDLLNDYLS
ncbi:MAG: hypothetical protein WBV73_14240 [Phormidium sp.]